MIDARFVKVSALVAVLIVALMAAALRYDGRRRGEPRAIAAGKLPIGMMGDSNTESYQDHVWFPDPRSRPGGAFHAITLQWPEVLARLRADQVDLGPWAIWGVRRWLSMARVRDGLGLPWRAPRKQTYQHNLAWASGCESLVEGPLRQTQRLVDVMDEQPEPWRRGVVFIFMGINNFGKDRSLDALARDPDDPTEVSKMTACVRHIRTAIDLIHAAHPQTRVVVFGIGDDTSGSGNFGRWQSATEQRNIGRGLDHFDGGLRALAQADPRIAFFDQRAWFARLWGGRDPDSGAPAYRPVPIGERLLVENAMGDSPEHTDLANGHSGLAFNTLLVQALIDLVRVRFDLPIAAVSDAEAARFVESRLAAVGWSAPTAPNGAPR